VYYFDWILGDGFVPIDWFDQVRFGIIQSSGVVFLLSFKTKARSTGSFTSWLWPVAF
jgi:hypothetical protein